MDGQTRADWKGDGVTCGSHLPSRGQTPRNQLTKSRKDTTPCALRLPLIGIFVVSQVLELYTSIDKMTATFDISKAREQFPALQQDQVFLDNAGGSQALGSVIDSYVLASQTP